MTINVLYRALVLLRYDRSIYHSEHAAPETNVQSMYQIGLSYVRTNEQPLGLNPFIFHHELDAPFLFSIELKIFNYQRRAS